MRNVTPVGRKPKHMESMNGDVCDICPKTGDVIHNTGIPKRFIIKRFFSQNKCLPEAIEPYKGILVKNMTQKQVNSLYELILGYRNERHINII